jgi:hypothetical protein
LYSAIKLAITLFLFCFQSSAISRMPQETPKAPETTEVPWHAAFPSPKTIAGAVSRDEVLQWLQQDKSGFILIDLRRTDCEVSTASLAWFSASVV